MFIRKAQEKSEYMNRIKYLILFCFIFPNILISQNINIPAVYSISRINQGDYQNALDTLNKLIEENPKAEYYLAKAETLCKTGNHSEACMNADLADKIKPNISSELKFRVYLEKDDYKSAEEALVQNLNSSYKISMYSLLNNADYNKIKGSDFLDDILQSNKYSKTEKQLYQVERLMNAEEFNQAYFLVNEIIARNKSIADVYYLLSKINQNSGNERQSLEAINSAIELKKSKPDFYKQRIALYKERGEYSPALSDVNKLLKLEPYLVDNHILKADLLVLNNKYDEANQLIEIIESFSEANPDMLFLQSKTNFQSGNYLVALQCINESMLIEQTKEQYELRADIYMETKTYDFAIRDYSMVLDMEPFNGEIYAKKGLVRYYSGDKEGACSDWKKGQRYGDYNCAKYIGQYCN
jgi:tetratricopeptide (TPR) repeat protein